MLYKLVDEDGNFIQWAKMDAPLMGKEGEHVITQEGGRSLFLLELGPIRIRDKQGNLTPYQVVTVGPQSTLNKRRAQAQ